MARRMPKLGENETEPQMFLPASSWEAPTSLPDWRGMGEIGLDCETKDEGLMSERGSGWPWRGGHVAGFSVACEAGSIYVPLRHPDTQNYDGDGARRWLRDVVGSARRVVTQAGGYDWGWLGADCDLAGRDEGIDDTQVMAVMLDENWDEYNLSAIAARLGLPGKDERLLREAAAAHGIGTTAKAIKSSMWKLPARFVGPYAEQDATATLQSAGLMRPMLEEQELVDAYQLEMDILPMVVAMRRRGIRVDTDAAEQSQAALRQRLKAGLEELRKQLGWSSISEDLLRSPLLLERAHDEQGVPYPKTPKTHRGSFKSGSRGGWMQDHPHWLPQTVAQLRQLDEYAEKFLGTYVLEFSQLGRIHAEIHQLRDDDGGTRTLRFSYSEPPLQQTPERASELAALVRGVFLPEHGERWCCNDFSQQEYRMIVHFAALLECQRAEEAVEVYRANPNTDFHQLVVDWTGLGRKQAKDANFAKAFGAAVPKFATMIKKSEAEAAEIYETYDEKLPFVSQAAEKVNKVAAKRGHIRMIDGARRRFDHYEPILSSGYYKGPSYRWDEAKERWPNARLRRADTRKGFNSLIQGSSARQAKKAMRTCYREGLLPMLQMHDELDHSVGTEAQGQRVAQIMREAVQLEVPSVVDTEFGVSWGDAKHRWEDVK